MEEEFHQSNLECLTSGQIGEAAASKIASFTDFCDGDSISFDEERISETFSE